MQKIVVGLVLTFGCATQSLGATNFSTGQVCKDELEGFDRTLEYLYRFDGNLPSLRDSKKKYIDSVQSKLHRRNSPKRTDEMSKQIIQELQDDHEYYLYQVSITSDNLIKKMERFRGSIDRSDMKVNELSKKYENGDSLAPWGVRWLIDDVARAFTMGFEVKDFFMYELPILSQELSRLGMYDRVSRSLGNEDLFGWLMLSELVRDLAECRQREIWDRF